MGNKREKLNYLKHGVYHSRKCASGYKVWPTINIPLYNRLVWWESLPKRGDTVKAFIILNDNHTEAVTEQGIIEWAKDHMAAYKYPRFIEFRDPFPTTASGIILWRELQEEERKKDEAVNER